MKVTVVTVGKLKEKYLKDAVVEYIKRISKFSKIEIIEVLEEKIVNNNIADNIKNKEAKAILKVLPEKQKNQYIIALSIEGEHLTSDGFANMIKGHMLQGISHIYFIIGGSLGLSELVLQRCNSKLSFSKMTFTHQLMQVILLEQIYRSFTILNGQKYHK